MAQATRPTKKTSSKVTAAKKKNLKIPAPPSKTAKIPPPPLRNWRQLFHKVRKGTAVRVAILLFIVLGIFVFNPQSGIINQNQSDNSSSTKSYKVDIRGRTLADPHQGDLKLKVGSHSILEVTTDEDGRLDLVSKERDVFNPIFSNVGNTLSVPTDRAESFRIEFHPANVSGPDTNPIVVGTVIVQD